LDGSRTPVRNVPPTLSATLGYLVPGPLRTEWLFSSMASMRDAIDDIVQAIAIHGMPVMTRYPDLQALKTWAENPQVEQHASCVNPEFLRAAIFYLLGDRNQATRIVAKQLASAEQNDPAILRLQSVLAESDERNRK
jgi:hypothetical protein